MTNADVAAALEEVADLLDFQGANPFRVRAYRNAARTVLDLQEAVSSYVLGEERRLTDIPGVGADLADKIASLVRTGTMPFLEELRAQVPPSVLAMLRVPGLGPKRAATIHKELGVSNRDQLREACEQHRVRALKGFGEKTETAILSGLDIAAQADQRMYWAHADQIAQGIREMLAACSTVERFEFAGSYRRGRETVGDLDIVAVAGDPKQAMDALAAYSSVASVLARGDTKMSVRLQSNLQVDLRIVPPQAYGAALQYFTGSKAHNVILRGMAKDRGWKLNEYGLFDGETLVAGDSEEAVYAALGLPWIPPELREARREFDWAAAGSLPNLIETGDLAGELHCHSTWSDGRATIEEMAGAARARGAKYIAITDHSKRTTVANGLTADRLLAQWGEIDKLNTRLKGIKVLKGVEVDILEAGGLDIPDDVLAQADWVVASLHFGQNQPRERITRRLLDAIENPHVSVIAHPTGRIISGRKPYDADWDAIFPACREHGKFLELNADPARLDLDDVQAAAAKSHGIPIVISTDAHSIVGLDAARYGVLQGRRAGLTKDDVVNTRSWTQVKKMLGKKR